MERMLRITGRFVRTDLDCTGENADPASAPGAMLVEDGRIVAIGAHDEVPAPAGARHLDLGEGWAIPGLIEPHGHPSEAALLMGDGIIDIRPVTIASADEVWGSIRRALAADPRPDRVLANGWDPLLQRGLVPPTRADLDALAGDIPLVIVHNSLHSAYFNTAAAREAGVDRDTPDPAGASYGRDSSGELSGVAYEAAAVARIAGPVMEAVRAQLPERMAAHLAEVRRHGITTIADLSWSAELGPLFDGLHAAGRLPVRVRGYEMSSPGAQATRPRDNGDARVRQTGIKVWSDGSPCVGNIATSFPYLDTEATRAIGLEPGHIGKANYTTEQLIDIGAQYAGEGWQLACHSHGDVAIDSTLDAYEELIRRFALRDHRFRVEHCGLMTPAQFRRAAALGVTVSLFVDHITYWATCSSTTSSASGARVGPTPAPPSRPDTAPPSTTTARSHRTNRCAIWPSPRPAPRAPADISTAARRSPDSTRCEPTPRTPPGSCAASTRSGRSRPGSAPTLPCSTSIRAPQRPKRSRARGCSPPPSTANSASSRLAAADRRGGEPARRTRLEQADLPRAQQGIGAAGDLQLAVDAARLRLDRVDRDVERARDLLDRGVARELGQHQ